MARPLPACGDVSSEWRGLPVFKWLQYGFSVLGLLIPLLAVARDYSSWRSSPVPRLQRDERLSAKRAPRAAACLAGAILFAGKMLFTTRPDDIVLLLVVSCSSAIFGIYAAGLMTGERLRGTGFGAVGVAPPAAADLGVQAAPHDLGVCPVCRVMLRICFCNGFCTYGCSRGQYGCSPGIRAGERPGVIPAGAALCPEIDLLFRRWLEVPLCSIEVPLHLVLLAFNRCSPLCASLKRFFA